MIGAKKPMGTPRPSSSSLSEQGRREEQNSRTVLRDLVGGRRGRFGAYGRVKGHVPVHLSLRLHFAAMTEVLFVTDSKFRCKLYNVCI